MSVDIVLQCVRFKSRTISSSQIGQKSVWPDAVPLEGPLRLMLEVRSWMKSGTWFGDGGDMEFCVEDRE
jgi:hypothetical protein